MFFNKKDQKQNEQISNEETVSLLPPVEKLPSSLGLEEGEDEVPRFYQKIDEPQGVSATSISKSTIFKGNMETKERLDVSGRIEGNVTSDALVSIRGTMLGELRCGALSAFGGRIEGNIYSAGTVTIEQGSQVTGNIVCESALISGEIIGNLDTVQGTVLTASATLTGDITASQIEIQKGAHLNGAVKMKKKSSADKTPVSKGLPPKDRTSVTAPPEGSAEKESQPIV